MLVSYVRDANRVPYATIVAVGPGKVGVAICNPKKDRFEKTEGRDRAAGRASTWGPLATNVHVSSLLDMDRRHEVRRAVDAMRERSRKYFQV